MHEDDLPLSEWRKTSSSLSWQAMLFIASLPTIVLIFLRVLL